MDALYGNSSVNSVLPTLRTNFLSSSAVPKSKEEISLFCEQLKSLKDQLSISQVAPTLIRMLYNSILESNTQEVTQAILDFLHEHPETLNNNSLDYLARALCHSVDWTKNDFQSIFNFMKSSPIVFRDHDVLEGLAIALSSSAFHTTPVLYSIIPNRDQKAKEQFEQLRDFVMQNQEIKNHSTFQNALKNVIDRDQHSINSKIEEEDRRNARINTIAKLTPLVLHPANSNRSLTALAVVTSVIGVGMMYLRQTS